MPAESAIDTAAGSLQLRVEHLMQRRRIHARSGVTTVDICGVPVDSLTLRGLLRSVCIQISQGVPGYIVTPNVDHVCRFQLHEDFREAYQHATLSLADGMPLLWASRLLKTPLPKKLSGSDIVYSLSEFAARKGYSVYFLGAAEGVAEEAAKRLSEAYPGLKVAGIDSPPTGFDTQPELNGETVRRVADSCADICFVALGSPKQELWMHKNCTRCGVPIMIGVGGSFDFVTGRIKRAPVWMQHHGLEWLWRLCHEPRRLWRRYLVTDPQFFWLLARDVLKGTTRRERRFYGQPPN